MKVIGLTGGSGSGKGAVGKILLSFGIPVIDTDAIYREMTEASGPCLSALKAEFGDSIITESGSLNRAALAELVFSGGDSEKRRVRLNEIAHKYILDEARILLNAFREQGYEFAVVDAPVLFESGFDQECDCIVCVIADREIRISRIMARDCINRERAEMRIGSQMADSELVSRSDYVIVNNSDLESLASAVQDMVDNVKMNYNLKGEK